MNAPRYWCPWENTAVAAYLCFIRTTLPWAAGITEIYVNLVGDRKPPVRRKLKPSVPCQRFHEIVRQLLHLVYKSGDNRGSAFILDFHQHEVTRVPFNKRCNVTASCSRYQIAFPMPGNSSILTKGGRSLIETAP